ncbi:TolC family protein [Parapedobacter soli]|uniref:TolC family protein n=1 Tax=Parapedobacter soli TaxID=416955 RepID=UPI0021C5E779|nr:TolC family protein [Parapedobacter soli]
MRTVSILVLLAASLNALAQESLQAYIDSGLQSNLLLQQRHVSFEKAVMALKSAKSLYLPSVNLEAGYQTADGGRNIPLPIGDLLNPVYATLNQLTESSQFPAIENETINFLPRNYYDAHIRTTLPLINTDIGHNKRIREYQVQLSELDVEAYKRELVKEIKVAYFGYLSAVQSVVVYRSALELAEEGKRTNERLVESGKGLPAYVLRSDGEVAAAQATLTAAEQQADNAKFYFNSLLNREAEAAIDTAFNPENSLLEVVGLLNGGNPAVGKREELEALTTAVNIRKTALKMDKQYAVPTLNAFLDLGSQSEGFRFNGQTRYYMAGLQLTFPIFNGNRNKYQVRQSQLDLRDAQLQLADASRQLQLSSAIAHSGLRSAWQHYGAAKRQLVAAAAYQRLITKGYQAGVNSYIETVDARNQYTSARLALSVSTYQVLSAAAKVEREQASYPLTANIN